MDFVDDLQRIVALSSPPQRIVSLVPSLTETLFALGAGERVVGVTDFCTHPLESVARITKVGGTKNPLLEKILHLEPDLVILNDEENRQEDFLWLAEHGLTLYVTAPRMVADGIAMIDKIGALIGCQDQSTLIVRVQRQLYDRLAAELADQPRLRVFCPIWRKPWMAFNADTYANDMLWCCGGENIFQAKSERYFTVMLKEVAELSPHVVLLPSEPYPFTVKHFVHLKPLANTPAGRLGHFYCVDGMALCWYGPRITEGLEQFSRLFAFVRSTCE